MNDMSTTHNAWTIQPLCFGEFPAVEKSGYTYARNQGEKMSAPAIAFLLRSGERTVLVDTGPVDPLQEHHPSHTPMRRTDDQIPRAALKTVGLVPEDLETVVLTHLHYDHAHNLESFTNATFIVQAEEARTAVDPVTAQKTMYEFGLRNFIAPWMRVTAQLRYVRGDVELFPGLRLLHLPGHTPGMQGVLLETERGPYLLAGDLVSLYDNLGTGADDWSVPGIHTDIVVCERSLERIHSLGATILPSHDWRVFDHEIYPQ